ncbi:hypothetical protein MNBD_GAMMA22-997 [hydrothermal vent metagenome]|uniref:VTT domain-containing protein n=1 Tax=hydrothermal vent metagenome TaxID=652676 RepID=A0A3B1AH57_9ZZZZ
MGFYSFLILSFGILILIFLYLKTKNKTIKNNLLFLLLLIGYLTLFFLFHHQIEKTCEILINDNPNEILNIIRSWGLAAPVISVLLMVLQAVIAPLPAYLITAANGIIFGFLWGIVISLIGAMLGALVSFSITRWFYNNYAKNKLKESKTQAYIEKISSKHGFKVILIARLIPLISFDLISYAAGASSIKISHFLLATFIGMLPATILYTAIANKVAAIEQYSSQFVIYSTLLAFILIIAWLIKNSLSKNAD